MMLTPMLMKSTVHPRHQHRGRGKRPLRPTRYEVTILVIAGIAIVLSALVGVFLGSRHVH